MQLKPIIMVVDDEPQIGEILTRFLAKHNYRPISFTSGNDALNYLSPFGDAHLKSPVGCLSARLSRPIGRPVLTPSCEGAHLANNLLPTTGLLLTDMDMPEMTGIELARQVKTLYPNMPIICMSGSANGQDREEVFKLGADFIPKPFDLPELLKRIDSLITQPAR